MRGDVRRRHQRSGGSLHRSPRDEASLGRGADSPRPIQHRGPKRHCLRVSTAVATSGSSGDVVGRIAISPRAGFARDTDDTRRSSPSLRCTPSSPHRDPASPPHREGCGPRPKHAALACILRRGEDPPRGIVRQVLQIPAARFQIGPATRNDGLEDLRDTSSFFRMTRFTAGPCAVIVATLEKATMSAASRHLMVIYFTCSVWRYLTSASMRAAACSPPLLSTSAANISAHAGISESGCTKRRRPSTALKTFSFGNRPWLCRVSVVRSDGRRSSDVAKRPSPFAVSP